ncbi:MAG: hypothetical protein AAGA33_14910, partial [Pseudomonadota bacterium]
RQTLICNGQGVVFEASGVVTSTEFFTTFESYFDSPDELFLPLRFSLTDLTDVERVEISTEDVADLGLTAKKAYQRNPDSIVAFAAPSDLTYGLANVFTAWTGPQTWTTNLLRDRPSAERWLRNELFERFNMENIQFDR